MESVLALCDLECPVAVLLGGAGPAKPRRVNGVREEK